MIQLTPRSRIEEFAREEYARHYARKEQEPVKIAGFDSVLGLLEDELLAFRGRVYRSPPVSYPDAVRLYELADRMTRLAAEASADVRELARMTAEVQREAVRCFWRLVQPVGALRFVPKFLLPNPFRNASPREVDELLGFFWERQMTSTVRHRGRTANRSL